MSDADWPPVGAIERPNRCTCNPPDDHDEECPLHGRRCSCSDLGRDEYCDIHGGV